MICSGWKFILFLVFGGMTSNFLCLTFSGERELNGGRVLSHLCVRLEGFTYSRELFGNHAQRCAGLPAYKQFVRVTCHVDYLSGFKGLTRWRGARNRMMAAPRIVMTWLLAACMRIVTGAWSRRPRATRDDRVVPRPLS